MANLSLHCGIHKQFFVKKKKELKKKIPFPACNVDKTITSQSNQTKRKNKNILPARALSLASSFYHLSWPLPIQICWGIKD